MPKSENRSYKKNTGKHRDARCFFIIAEGEREENYFQWFERKWNASVFGEELEMTFAIPQ